MEINIDNLLKKIVESNASAGGVNITDGIYEYTIESVKWRHGDVTSFIAELRVDDARAVAIPPSQLNLNETSPKPNEVGTTVRVAYKTDKKSAPGNIKAFMLAALDSLGMTDLAAGQLAAEVQNACSGANPLRGLRIGNATYRSKIRTGEYAGQFGTWCSFKMIPQTVENLQHRRADLDGGRLAVSSPPQSMNTAIGPVTVEPTTSLLGSIGLK